MDIIDTTVGLTSLTFHRSTTFHLIPLVFPPRLDRFKIYADERYMTLFCQYLLRITLCCCLNAAGYPKQTSNSHCTSQ